MLDRNSAGFFSISSSDNCVILCDGWMLLARVTFSVLTVCDDEQHYSIVPSPFLSQYIKPLEFCMRHYLTILLSLSLSTSWRAYLMNVGMPHSSSALHVIFLLTEFSLFQTHSLLFDRSHASENLHRFCNISISAVVYFGSTSMKTLANSIVLPLFTPLAGAVYYKYIHHWTQLVGIQHDYQLNTISDWSSPVVQRTRDKTYWIASPFIWLRSIRFSEMGHLSSAKPCVCALL
jgi:hypothetical protein